MGAAQDASIELGATMGLAFLAADFCTQPETWPVFLAWVHDQGDVRPARWTREVLASLVPNLHAMMKLAEVPDGV